MFEFIASIVVLVTAVIEALFSVLSRSEVRKQAEIKKEIDTMWEGFRKDETDHRIVRLQKIADYLQKRISTLGQEVSYAKNEYRKLLAIEHDKQQVLTPNALQTIYQSIYLIQSCIDNLQANQFYAIKMRRKALSNIKLIQENHKVKQAELDSNYPVRSVRGQSLFFRKTELNGKSVTFDGIKFVIEDWDDRQHFLSVTENEEIPLFIHSFDPESQIGNLSFARGRMQSRLNEGFNAFKCRMENVSGFPIKASYYSINNIRIPRRGLSDQDSIPKLSDVKLLYVWKTDRHLDYVLAGEYNFAEAMSSTMLTVPILIPSELQKKTRTKLGQSIILTIQITGLNGMCFYRGGEFIYKFTVTRYGLQFTEANRFCINTSDNAEMLSFTVVFSNGNSKNPMQQIQMLAFQERYTKEEERQQLFNASQTEKSRLRFFIMAFQRLKDQYKVQSSTPIAISKLMTAQDSKGNVFLNEVHSPQLYLALHKMGKVLNESLYNTLNQSFCLKIEDQVYIVNRIQGDRISLQSQMLHYKSSSIKEGILFLSEVSGLRSQEDALNRFRKGEILSSDLHQAIIYPQRCPGYELKKISIQNPKLNPSQREAVCRALSSPDLFLIQGPPGTGKTTVIVEIVRAQLAINPKSRILITSQSHVAVDNAMEDLVCDDAMKKLCCRMGSDTVRDKISPKLFPYYTKKNIPQHARIIGVTLGSIPSVKYERLGAIDLSIIDEAAKASLPETLPGILCARRLVLVGDHKQLPPMVEDLPDGELSDIDKEKTELWETSLFEMMMHDLPEDRKILLNTQHRMVAPIGDIVSNLFYERHLACGVASTPERDNKALYWYDCKWGNHYISSGNSKYNIDEATKIKEYVLNTLSVQSNESGISSVVILSAYRAQCEVLHKVFFPYYKTLSRIFQFSISTIDAYQGQQADVVIYSTVTRSGGTSFLKDKRRLNVVLSRARYRFVLFGKSDLLCQRSVSNDQDLYGSIFRHPLMNVIDIEAKPEANNFSEMKGMVYLLDQEKQMNKNLLILTLGSRDIMKLVDVDAQVRKTRVDCMPINDIQVQRCIDIPDLQRGERSGQAIGYCFPILEKALYTMKHHHKATPDSIILIYTDRKELLHPLRDVLLYLDKTGFNSAIQFTKFLIEKIQSDNSPDFATTIRENLSIEKVRVELGLNKAVETLLIGLGRNYEQFKQVRSSKLKKMETEDEVMGLLSLCDINREGFLYPAIYNELLPIIKDYQDYNVFCSTSGGLSQVGNCLSTVLDHLLVSSNRIVLQIPEDKGGFVFDPLAGRYNRYFQLKREFDKALLQLDPDLAKQVYKAIVAQMSLPEDSLIRKTLDPMVQNFSWSICESGFEMVTLRLLNAMYQAKYDVACMWAVSLMESSVRMIIRGLKDPEITLDEYDNIVLHAGNKVEYISNLKKLFLQRIEWKRHEQLNQINKLIKFDLPGKANLFNRVSRISQNTIKADSSKRIESEEMKRTVLDFLGITSEAMQQQFLHLCMGDWERLMENEDALFGKESVLYKLRQIISGDTPAVFKSALRRAAYKIYSEQENLIYVNGVEELLIAKRAKQ